MKSEVRMMRNTSLCYIEHEGKYLMLHRVKKTVDENKDKWIGIGGKFEEGESPEECCLREISEETGMLLSPADLRFRGIVSFVSDEWGTEYMFLFTASVPAGTEICRAKENDEGELEWVEKSAVTDLPIWEGDRVFLRLLSEDSGFFSLKLRYEGDRLVETVLY